jgi:hypothetical protein
MENGEHDAIGFGCWRWWFFFTRCDEKSQRGKEGETKEFAQKCHDI